MSDYSTSGRGDLDLILSPSSTLCSASPALRSFEISTTPHLEMDSIDTSPFSDSFSGLIEEPVGWQKGTEIAHVDASYDIERFTNVKELDPEWDDEDVDEILVMSAKVTRKLSTIEEETPRMTNSQLTTMSDFELLPFCRGGTKQAQLYRKRDTGQIYAFRTFRDIAKPSCEQTILNMIKDLKAPFLPRIHWTFWERGCVSMVMEHYPPKNLRDLIDFGGALQREHAHFYACELVQAMSALHVAGIVHRDLRPENVLIDSNGHIVLDGFASSEILRQSREAGEHNYLFCTTPISGNSASRAPELLLGWAHDFAVDCWGFGLVLRFMLSGMHLFGPDWPSRTSWRDLIVHDPIPLCPLIESSAQDLIDECLERNPIVRLSLPGIKKHAYFAATDWKKVAAKRIRVPFPLDPKLESNVSPLGFQIDKTGFIAPKTGARHSRDSSRFGIPASISNTTSEDALLATSASFDDLHGLPRIFRMSSLLDDLPETMESMSPSDPTMHSALTLNDSPPNVLKSDINPQDRMALFWETLDSEQVSVSPAPSINSTDTTPRPRKLRKSRSSIYPEQRFSTLSTSSLQNKLRKKVRPAPAPPPLPANDQQTPPEPDLPEGVTQIGSGIGFTYNIPVAVGSGESICSDVPQTCHGMFQGRLPSLGLGLGLGSRSTTALAKAKARRTLLSLAIPQTQTQEDMDKAAFPRDFRGSSWSLVTPSLLPVSDIESQSAEGALSSPVSDAGPLTPATLVYEEPEVVVIGEDGFKEGVAQEVKAGDVEVTLRLVGPCRRVE
ncbi:kinase-like domain-containing protein [Lyophyllum atratum]|nr:kinase-like domain-containing protein [Lyophyllum atratum]